MKAKKKLLSSKFDNICQLILIIYAQGKFLQLYQFIFSWFDNFPNLSMFCQVNKIAKAVVYPISFHQQRAEFT